MQKQWLWFGDQTKTKGQETQLRIIKVAVRLFSQQGFQATTLQQIAKKAKASHPLILKHFDDKETLLFAVRRYVTHLNHTWVDERIEPTDDGKTNCYTFCIENLNWAYQHPDEGKIILLAYYYSSLGKSQYNPMGSGLARLEKYVQQAQKDKSLNAKADVKLTANLLQEYTVGSLVKMLVGESFSRKSLPSFYRKRLQSIIDLLIC